jgi:hypothetical protein
MYPQQFTQESQNKDNRQALGKEMDHFSPRHQSINRWLVVILGIILLLDASVFALISIFNLWNATQSHGRAILLALISEPLIAVGLILPAGILLIFLAAINWQNGITLYENGLVIRRGNREKSINWDDIERFDNRITLVKFSGTTVTARSKILLEDEYQNHLMIGNKYDRMDEMIALLRRHVLPGLFMKFKRRLQHGERIQFHSDIIAVNEGLQIKRVLFPWNELKVTADKKGKIRIINLANQQELFKSKTTQIKNVDALMHLVENPPIPKTQALSR